MAGSLAKLMGVENGSSELPRRLPAVPKSTSVVGRVDGGRLVGFIGARRRPRENPDGSGMQSGV